MPPNKETSSPMRAIRFVALTARGPFAQIFRAILSA
jgi:hypothetical protein